MNKKFKIIIAIIIAVIIVGGAAFYLTTQKIQPEKPDLTANWGTASKIFHNGLGLVIKYPNDDTYGMDETGIDPAIEGFTLFQAPPGNRFHVYKTSDSALIASATTTKVINGITYKVVYREGIGSGYGYITEHNGEFYVFESTIGPLNDIFELMMTTIEFSDGSQPAQKETTTASFQLAFHQAA